MKRMRHDRPLLGKGKNVHRGLNPFQFKNVPVTEEEKNVTSAVFLEPSEGGEDEPFGLDKSRRVLSLPEAHRKKIIK
jgi:hypothetical protein